MISSTASSISYTSTAAQTVFAFPFRILSSADIKVYKISGGVRSDITGSVESYTGVDSEFGGSVTLPAQTSGDVILLVRDTPFTQATDFSALGFFSPAQVERTEDKAVVLAQEVKRGLGSTLRMPLGETMPELPGPSLRANKFPTFDTAGSLALISQLGVLVGADANSITVASVADLRNIITDELVDNQACMLLGYTQPGDGGGGVFFFVSAATDTDDAGRVLQPNVGPGRWFRVNSGNKGVNVMWYGAVGNGIADDTVSLQRTLDATHLDGASVYFPTGHFLTGTLDYKGQSMFGDGVNNSRVVGKPSQDIFLLSASAPLYSRTSQHISDMEFFVDDTVDASASFPNRYGVGNACFAAVYEDADSALPLSWHNYAFSRVRFYGTTDMNTRKTCGFWSQRIVYNTVFDHCEFHTDYGFIIAAPNNLAVTNTFGGTYDAFSNDRNCFRQTWFVCRTMAFQHINGTGVRIDNMQVYGGLNGVYIRYFPNNNQGPGQWAVDSLFVEGQTVQGLRIQGGGHSFRQLVFSPNSLSAAHGDLIIECDRSTFNDCVFFILGSYAGCKHLVLALGADQNHFRLCRLVPSVITDLAKGTHISAINWTDATRHPSEQIATKNKAVFNQPDGTGLLFGISGGIVSPGIRDLFFQPSDISWGAGPVTITKDSSLEFGEKATCADYIYFSYVPGRQLKFGIDIPRGRVKTWIKLKRSAAGSVSKALFLANGTVYAEYGNTQITYDDQWSVQGNEHDCSAAAVGDVCQLTFFCEGGGVTTDIAWVAFQPLPDELSAKKILHPVTSSAPSPDVLYGGLVTWWDGTNFKAKKPDGTTVNIV